MPENIGPEFASHLKELKWKQGEHIFVSGSTGSGKTTLISEVLEKREYTIAFGVKVKDDTIKTHYKDWQVVGSMKEIEPWMDKVFLWPRLSKKKGGNALLNHQRETIQHAFDVLLTATGWTIFADEVNYLAKYFNVGRQIEALHYIGRSSGISMVTAGQRPANIPLAILSNSSHAYIGRTRLATDLKRLSDFGDIDAKANGEIIAGLDSKYDFYYFPTQGSGVSRVVNTRR